MWKMFYKARLLIWFLYIQQKGFCCPFPTVCVVTGEAQSAFNIDHVVGGKWVEPETWQTPDAHTAYIIKSISSSETGHSTELPHLNHCFYFYFFICSRLCGDYRDVEVGCWGYEYDKISRIQIEVECTGGLSRDRTEGMNHNYLQVLIQARIHSDLSDVWLTY